MDWTEIVVAIVAAAGGCLGAIVSNNRHLAVLETKLDALKEELVKQGNRIDQHNHLNERITKLEVMMEERKSP
ncbi:MAG: hypothetical protein J6U54_03450 [Clostridiales bacterium]|nr:hypothetical protein [Clostridiales bacterium]